LLVAVKPAVWLRSYTLTVVPTSGLRLPVCVLSYTESILIALSVLQLDLAPSLFDLSLLLGLPDLVITLRLDLSLLVLLCLDTALLVCLYTSLLVLLCLYASLLFLLSPDPSLLILLGLDLALLLLCLPLGIDPSLLLLLAYLVVILRLLLLYRRRFAFVFLFVRFIASPAIALSAGIGNCKRSCYSECQRVT
jgi:hypothetical protein